MKFTRERVVNGKKQWVFYPPKDVRDAGVAKAVTFNDGRIARFEIPKLIDLVSRYRKGEIKEGNLSVNSLVVHLRNHYINSEYFSQLANSSQRSYESTFDKVCNTSVKGKLFGEYKLKEITTELCRCLYNQIVKDVSVYTANHSSRVMSVLFNYGVRLELLEFNPLARVKKLKHEPTTRVWTPEEVETFLECAYSKFEYRSVGLMTHMCYEWAQRPVDIMLLKWSNFDWDNYSVTIKQSKRGATVHLPLEEPLRSLLIEQKNDWDFQEWVCPYPIPSGTVYKGYRREQLGADFSKVRREAGLDTELTMGNLRKTALVEMVEAGVDITGIMQVSGHKSLNSVSPYMKHTLKGATKALSVRKTGK